MKPAVLPLAVLALLLAAAPAAAQPLLDIFPGLPWTRTGSQPGQSFGHHAAPAGDVDGDGFGDILVFAATEDTSTVRAALFLGGPNGPSALPAWTLSTTSDDTKLLRPAGDVNGDGYADILWSRAFASVSGFAAAGRVAVFHGGPGGLPAVPTYELVNPAPASFGTFGYAVDYAGDVNGDGYSDVVVSTPNHDEGGITDRGVAYVYHGGPGGLGLAPARTLLGPPGQAARFGEAASTAGDVDGDGHDDLVIGAAHGFTPITHGGTVSLYLGSASGIPATPDTVIVGLDFEGFCGTSVSTAGDVNGDGYADFLYGCAGDASALGRANLVYGGPDGVASRQEFSSPIGAAGDRFGRVVTTLGDTDGDGYPEFAVAGMNPPTMSGHALVYRGFPFFTLIGRILPPVDAGVSAFSIAGSGDVDGDGRGEILLGDPLAGGTGRIEFRGRLRTTTSAAPGWPLAAPQQGTRYGQSLAITQGRDFFQLPRLVIGDPQFDGFGRVTEHVGGSGSVALDPQAAHTVTSAANAEALGSRVADAGDFDGDGFGDYVVSATGAGGGTFQNPLFQVGRVLLVRGGLGAPVAPVSLLLGERDFDRVGSALAGRGDVNGDGYHDVLIGAREADTASLSHAGRAWVVFGGPAPPPPWSIAGTEAGQGLGAGVALLDLDGDAYTDVAIGSSSPAGGPQPGGKVQVHYGGPAGPSNAPGLVLFPPLASSSFGFTVVALGDVNGDGVADLGVGAPLEDGRGVARVYSGTLGRSQSQIPMIFFEGDQAGGRFGEAMTGGGDVDGDGIGDLAIGQPGYDRAGLADRGRAVFHFGVRPVPAKTPSIVLEGTGTGAELGASFAPLADVNADGFADWIVGAPGGPGRVHANLGGAGAGRRHQLLLLDNVAKRFLHPPTKAATAQEMLVGLFPHAPMGRTLGGLELEIRTQNEVFTGDPTFATPLELPMGVPGDGSSTTTDVDVSFPGHAHHLRVRQVTRSPFFQRSAWASVGARTTGEHDFRLSGAVVSVPPPAAEAPAGLRLGAAAPNPAGGLVPSRIEFALPSPGHARVDVHDVRGARVRRIADGMFAAGVTTCAWDGRDERGRRVAPGVYFVVLTASAGVERGRIVRLP